MLPPEVAIKKEIAAQRARLAATTEPEARKAAMAELAKLQMRDAMMMEFRAAGRFAAEGGACVPRAAGANLAP